MPFRLCLRRVFAFAFERALPSKGRCACLPRFFALASKVYCLSPRRAFSFAIECLCHRRAFARPLPSDGLCHQTNLAFGFDMEGPLPLKRLFRCLPFCIRGAIRGANARNILGPRLAGICNIFRRHGTKTGVILSKEDVWLLQ